MVQGDTLFETLALNLLQYPDDDIILHSPEDRPAWELDDPYTPERDHPLGYLDYLTWQNRRVLYLPETTPAGTVVRRMTVAPALRLASGVLEPMSHYRQDKKYGPMPLSFTEGRALWRDSAALFRLRDEDYRPPRTFRWLSELVYEGCVGETEMRRYLALGMSKKQAKVNFFRSERMPLPLEYLREIVLVEALEMALEMAEGVSSQLWGTSRTLATLLLSPEADAESGRQPDREDLDRMTRQWAMERRYWSRLELPFRETMEALPTGKEEALGTWSQTLRRTAWNAFEAVAGNLGHDPRSLKAVVRAREQLAAGLAKALPQT
jgi:CRISPR system Cascade subunit CasA